VITTITSVSQQYLLVVCVHIQGSIVLQYMSSEFPNFLSYGPDDSVRTMKRRLLASYRLTNLIMKDTKKAGCTSSRCFALGGTAVLFVYQVIGLIRSSSNALFNEYSDVWLDHTTTSTLAPIKKKKRNLARGIVNKAYESTYIIFDEGCHEGESFALCVARLHSLTILRDANEKNVLFGHWRFVRIENPPMQFCSIEKVACSEWRDIGCALNRILRCNSARLKKLRVPSGVIY
jgi:hypothetical protein